MKLGSTLGGSLLVAGLTIGAGMLALPVVTGESGLLGSLALFVIYWVFSLLTSLMFLEVNLCFTKPVNFVSMAGKTLGRPGKIIAWGLYLLLLYTLTAAYLAGSHFFIPGGAGPLFFVAIFGTLVSFSTKIVDFGNRFLMAGLLVSYVVLIGLGLSLPGEVGSLQEHNWQALWPAIPVVVTAFGFHIIIPTLTTYLGRDVVRIKRALFYGSFMALLFYSLFQAVMLRALPVEILVQANRLGLSATAALASYKGHSAIAWVSQIFSFFAITTSFLGVSLSLRDFLADGLKMGKKKLLLTIATYLPPLFFVFVYPRAFIMALDFAGIFVALLLGIWPILMVLRKRMSPLEGPYQLGGGGATLFLTFVVYLTVLVVGFLYL